MRDYAELVNNLRKMQSTEYCAIASATDFPAIQIALDAADAIEELLAAAPRWISVEERLPEKHVEVLICTEDYGKNELGFATVAVWDGSEWIETWDRQKSVHYVSHWMPLPEPPKEDAK